MDRWATFDCYGTLIDWDGGIRTELARVFGEDAADEQLERYHEVEPEIQRDATLSYRQVMTDTMRRLGAASSEAHGLAEALPGWRAFPEAHRALEEARRRGWKLGVLSNTDDDYIAASQVQIGITFDEVIVAQEIGSYKPALAPLGGVLRTHARAEGAIRPCRRVALPRHRPGERARGATSGSTASARQRPRREADARADRPVCASRDAR